ncbi:MAG: heterodisulfide reductase-related iron-sulfur binding cluster [Chloroflexota bacterium]|nr:heterodisulfide reductase-related iron-sulfur binding cluster [Chloroflexota bacterium]
MTTGIGPYPRCINSTSPHVRTDDLDTCISCGLCLNDCPTYRVLGDEADSPRGRLQLIRMLVGSEGPPEPRLVGHLEACLVCRACETVCPSNVPFGRIMEGAREVLGERHRTGVRTRLARRLGLAVLARPRLVGAATTLAGLYAASGLQSLVRRRRLIPRPLAAMESLLRRPEGSGYRPASGPTQAAPASADNTSSSGAGVQFFAGCVMRSAFGESDRATVRVLERSGYAVTAPEGQVCCGALHAHAGDGRGARALAKKNVAAFGDGDARIVVNAAGCGAHLKAYGDVLGGEPSWREEGRRFATRVRDASEVADPRTPPRAPQRPLRVVYQDACHLAHGQGIRRQPRELLRAIPGVQLVDIADAERCCGSAGIYNLTHPTVARELQQQKVRAIADARPDLVVSANPGCILQLEAGLREAGARVPVLHLMRFVDDPTACL